MSSRQNEKGRERTREGKVRGREKVQREGERMR